MGLRADSSLFEDRFFFKMGGFTHDHRKKVLALGILACFAMASLIGLGPDWAEAWGEGDMESLDALAIKNDAFGEGNVGGSHGFVLLVHHSTLNDTSEAWQQEVIDALAMFAALPDVTIEYSWEFEGDERREVISEREDGFWAQNRVVMNLSRKDAKVLYGEYADTIEMSDDFNLWRTDGMAIEYTFDHRIEEDLVKAEIVSGPLSLIILAIVFGTLLAALLPVGVGILTVLSAMGVTIWLSNVTDVTQYAVNIISLIGIGVSIDYSLFLVNRFREEMERNPDDIRTATAMSVATAGKAVFFSGITVAIGLMGMLFFTNTSLPSLGIGGTLAVTIAMVFSLIVLPAALAILGPKINSGWKLPFSFSIENNDDEDGVWARIANTVMDRPWAVLIPTLIILLGAGLPFFHAEFSLANRDALPPDDESRMGLDQIDEIWPKSTSNAALVVIDFDGTDPLNETNLRTMHRWMVAQIDDERITEAFGYALPQMGMNESTVVQYWATPPENLSFEQNITREYLREQFVAGDVTYVVFAIDGPSTSVESHEFVADLREGRDDFTTTLITGEDSSLKVAGFAAYSLDTLWAIQDNLPIALAFILIATIVLIFIQVRSVVIPIKAIVMNILSISASFGMLVFVFQWGYGADLLNFTPQPIEATNPVIMFCIVFGLSMDYEVLMLSRIHEEWERTGDNTLAVANGLQKTGRLITGAAAIMVVVFSAFGLSSIIILKQIGLGLALAILLDATVVRALVVPATMRLMGKWNWWSPKWLDKFFPAAKPQKHSVIQESE
ncbi:MAG: MMPL family transporter [Euryarchaeota archaeon]|jgi:RND superfamily putative drug exporter|nr:MMPL family transporter [Euryarchaeota archaeon]